MRVLLTIFGLTLIVQPLGAQKTYAACYKEMTTSEFIRNSPRFLIVTESESPSRLIPHFDQLLSDSILLLHANQKVTIDIRPCSDLLFSRTTLSCDTYQDKLKYRVGYSNRYFDEKNNQWFKVRGYVLERTNNNDKPVIFHTLFGKYLYDADLFLKKALLDEIKNYYEPRNIEPPEHGKATFRLAETELFSRDAADISVQYIEMNHLIELRLQDSRLKDTSGFMDRVLSSGDAAMERLTHVISTLFVASRSLKCLNDNGEMDDSGPDERAWPPITTPSYTEAMSRELTVKRDQYLVLGGVQIDLENFDAINSGIPEDEFESIKKVIYAGEREKTAWSVDISGTRYYANVVRFE